jgi:N-acyl homoserine lactone hydrolase
MRKLLLLLASVSLAACNQTPTDDAKAGNAAAPAAAALSLTRLDCGTIRIKNFDRFFSDKPGLYEAAPRDITDSCYLIRHGDQQMLWDTGLSADLKGSKFDAGEMTMSLTSTLAEQLAAIGLKPADIDIVGISHHHADHTGQAAAFPQARLIIGAADFEQAKTPPPQGGPSPIAPWLKGGAKVAKLTGDSDLFGDGSVVALHLPGHTPDHLALLVNLKSGPVLLTGDLYHSSEARAKRGVPPFNTSREQTLASMDSFEARAKATGAKVVIQHEPGDIGKLPAFPKAAE